MHGHQRRRRLSTACAAAAAVWAAWTARPCARARVRVAAPVVVGPCRSRWSVTAYVVRSLRRRSLASTAVRTYEPLPPTLSCPNLAQVEGRNWPSVRAVLSDRPRQDTYQLHRRLAHPTGLVKSACAAPHASWTRRRKVCSTGAAGAAGEHTGRGDQGEQDTGEPRLRGGDADTQGAVGGGLGGGEGEGDQEALVDLLELLGGPGRGRRGADDIVPAVQAARESEGWA